MTKNYHVVPKNGEWAVKKEGTSKSTSLHKTQKEAIHSGTQNAKNQKVELFIHGENGKIRERNSFGNDPFPPRG